MKCPYCNKDLIIPPNVYLNVESYGNSVLSITECCKKGVMVRPNVGFIIDKYNGVRKEDDWGNKIK